MWRFPPTLSLDSLRAAQQHFSAQVPDMHTLIIMLLMPALFALFEQDLAQIFFASKTKKVATMAAIATTVFMLTFGLIPIYLGAQAQLMGMAVATNHSPLLALIKSISNSFILVMVACGILAAIASTADALLCAIGANITQDFSLSFLGLSPLVESKATIFTMGMVVLGLSYVIPSNVISILIRSYELPVNCLLIPILAAYFFDDAVKRYAGIGGLLGGLAGLVFFNFIFPVSLPSLYTLGLSLAGYLVGFFLQKKLKTA
jgi:Na+/proline symporter